jgi:hypothetical protein
MDYTYRERHGEAIYRFKNGMLPNDSFRRNRFRLSGGRHRHSPARRHRRRQQFRRETLLLEQLAHQPQRRPGVASALDQHVKDLAFVVDDPPQYIPSAAIRTTISSRHQRLLGRGRCWRNRPAITGPNFSTQRRTVS